MSKKEFKPEGVLTLSNHGGIGIRISDDGDKVIYQYYEDEPQEADVEYDEDGEPYFRMGLIRNKYYINQFLRTDI